MRDEAMIQQVNASSIRDKMTRAQQMTKNLESAGWLSLRLKSSVQDDAVSVMEKKLAELKKYKEESVVATEKLDKETTELRRREIPRS
ncbi:hypothetical protein Acr_17g0009350 [Actinidia rufa]|uniref:Uncharacterized protein n=1 Tax=Actinidia rufa TaxID=165716 RepID=A0A7J0G3K6_9ERIC|nr:hypothetical protein Acr_17g0009350 [Actinidia rufa]